ncbi:hypothetical protein [Arthrobacter sp. H35-D1]|uniref:hypothetical protein n=1 Tax=Arthrobacter sp. H35-D1 TaxID=3046202 RepID=UPI0024BA3EE6|nr:hypothetical protein [Arthrobacter sp. H35-D1]MDJ0315067.1 hypothetical protein [Arthrobacter sp. H35-D1]
MNVREAMEAVKDGTFEERVSIKRLARDFVTNSTKNRPTSSVAKGRELHATMHPNKKDN